MRRSTRLRRGLLSWLTNAALPVFVLDERRVILFFNRGCEELTGCEAAEVIGKSCSYVTGGDPQATATIIDRLCPPPGVLKSPLVSAPAELLHKDGTAQARTIHFFVLRESDEASAHVIGIIGPRGVDVGSGEVAAAARRHAALAALCSELRLADEGALLIGHSAPVRRLREQIKIAAGGRACVHLYGERGAGREQFAHLVHARSERSLRAFVPLDCSQIPPVEIKVAVRGLLSPAEQSIDETLRAGALFLKSVGDLPRDVQELLVTLSAERAAAGWQLISADHRRLADLAADHTLLPEFVELLSEFTIDVPALRARRDDLPLIAQFILESLNRGDSRQIGGFAAEVWDQFAKYDWPGNLPELQAVITEARAACNTSLITSRDLPFRFRTGLSAQATGPSLAAEPVNLEEILARVEADHIRWALSAAKSNKSAAAALLGLTRPRLYRRMETLGISDDDPQS
ncbi:MAG: sigma 54-interacting transcriptional regulator [Planctomycetaceae bacterium]